MLWWPHSVHLLSLPNPQALLCPKLALPRAGVRVAGISELQSFLEPLGRGGVCAKIQAAAVNLLLMITELPWSCPVLAGPGGSGEPWQGGRWGGSGQFPWQDGLPSPSQPAAVPPRECRGHCQPLCCPPPCPALGQEHPPGRGRGSWDGPGHPSRVSHSWVSPASSERQTSAEGATERKLPLVQRESCECQLHGMCV